MTGCKKHIFERQRQSFYEGTMNLETYVSARDRPKVLDPFDKQTLRELDIKTRTMCHGNQCMGSGAQLTQLTMPSTNAG